MIASLRGILLESGPHACLVEAGGVGYEVAASLATLRALPARGEEVRLLTYFHVREDAQQLFGFAEAAEKQAFTLLLGVTGVGPKVALSLLSALSPAELREAVKKRRLAALVAVPGVGKKLAERLILELSDKVEGLAPGQDGRRPGEGSAAAAEDGRMEKVAAALVNLGYSAAVAREAARKALEQAGPQVRLEEWIKLALKSV